MLPIRRGVGDGSTQMRANCDEPYLWFSEGGQPYREFPVPYWDMMRRATPLAASDNPEMVPFVTLTAVSAVGAPPPVIR